MVLRGALRGTHKPSTFMNHALQPFATSSVLAPSSDANSFLFLVVKPGAPSSVLASIVR